MSALAGARQADEFRFFAARHSTPVRVTTKYGAPIIAVLGPGAVAEFRRLDDRRGCEQGWYARHSGGYVCGKHLVPSKERSARVAPVDDPGPLKDLLSFWVPRFGPRVFESAAQIDLGVAMIRLRKGSAVRAVGPIFRRNGRQLVKNRKGFFIEAERLEPLSGVERSLGLAVSPDSLPPFGVVTGTEVRVKVVADPEAAEMESLPRWSWLEARPVVPALEVAATPGWVRLPSGGYVEDGQVSVVRQPKMPADLAPEERWIAIDLQEQLALAYEGTKLVRVIPCSTGEKGNTPTGEYRIELKKRLHTMRLLMGQIRVEDVPWVMFFDRKEGLAIHSAYWHSDYGLPRSHGCVNLPEYDAKWIYEWSSPRPAAEDSETMAEPGGNRSRIVIF